MALINNTVPVVGESIDLKLLDRALSSKDIQLKPQYSTLITQLLKVHETGMLHYSIATSSFELRIPDPNLLIEDGPKELFSKHLYINLTKYIEQQHSAPARCVKNGQVYTMLELLNMSPLKDRQDTIPWDIERFLAKYKQKTLIIPKTVLIADPDKEVDLPGDCIPITELDTSHPAITYLLSRGFTSDDLSNLYKQFKLSFCIKSKHDFYKDEYMGLSKSPVGKLIFFIYQFGKLKGWQSRRLEKREGDTIYHFYYDHDNPYKTGWIPVGKYNTETKKIQPLPDVPKKVLESKYVIGFGTRASESLLGFDAALEHAKKSTGPKQVVIAEGALDAAKFGIPACCVFGCRLSKAQATLLCNNFDQVFYLKDHDLAGEELKTSITQEFLQLYATDKLKEIEYPEIYKDIGDISDKQIIINLKQKYGIL